MNKRDKIRVKMLLDNLSRELCSMVNAHHDIEHMLNNMDSTDLIDGASTPLGLSRRADEAAAGCASSARYGFREIAAYCRKNIKETPGG